MSDVASDAKIKTFTTRRRNADEDPVVPFDIDGHTFHLHPKRINGFVLMDLGNMRIAQDSKPMWEFFEGLLADDYPRFRELLRSPDVEIDADWLRDMVQWMAEQSAEHPTQPSSS